MNKIFGTTLTGIAVLALAGVIFWAGGMYSRFNTFGPSMMNGRGGYDRMMNSRRPSMMGSYGYNDTNFTSLTIDQAKAAAEKYLANLNNSDLKIAEVMIFDNNAYVVVKEASTGIGAFELLVDPASQVAYPEHGPNMMWNLKYSGFNHQDRMGGKGSMMGGWNSAASQDISTAMTVTPEQAIEYAQNYLDTNISGATAAADPIQFHGYYTLDFEKDGKVAGMLSVNGYSGQIFLHTWHGMFIEESEIQ